MEKLKLVLMVFFRVVFIIVGILFLVDTVRWWIIWDIPACLIMLGLSALFFTLSELINPKIY